MTLASHTSQELNTCGVTITPRMRGGEKCLLHTSCFTHVTHTPKKKTEIVILEFNLQL